MKVYVASPKGFSELDKIGYMVFLTKLQADALVDVIDPWALTSAIEIETARLKGLSELHEMDMTCGERNRDGIDESDMVVAILDGPDVDSGTAAEIGYAYGIGKKIVGYRGDFRPAGDNAGVTVNLQVEYFIRTSGGTIFSDISTLCKQLFIFSGDNLRLKHVKNS